MSMNKLLSNRASRVRLDPSKVDDAAPVGGPRTAPGHLLFAQATVEKMQTEIESLKEQLLNQRTEIPLELIDEVAGRRRKLSSEQYAELKANLTKNKLAQPITVRRKADGRYELVAGHNRTSIFRELGRTTIPAAVIEVDDNEINFVAFFSNLLSPSLSDFEKFWNFRQLVKQSGSSQQAIAEAAGISQSHVSRIMSFDGLPDDALAALEGQPDRLGSDAAAKLAELARAGRGKEVTEAVKALVANSDMTQKDAIAQATPKREPAPQPESLTVKQGKATFCDVKARGKVVGVSFGKTVSETEAAEWAALLRDFIEAEMKRRLSGR